MMHKATVAAAAGLAALFISTGAMAGKDLDTIKARGALICGIGQGTAGFMLQDSQGKWIGLDFTAVTYYDGQGFLVNKKLGVKSAKELNGATVCVAPGTTTELNLADYFRANKMEFKPGVIEDLKEVEGPFFSGRCDVYPTDASGLASARAVRSSNAEDYLILPEIISKEPLAPA